MSKIFTERLLLMTCSLDLAKSILLQRTKLEERSPITIPSDWPSNELKNILPLYIEMLETTDFEKWFEIWVIIDYNHQKIIGSIRLTRSKESDDTIDIGYEIIQAYRNKGYGYEAVKGLVDFVFQNGKINKMTAECDRRNIPSIKILQKLGMCCVKQENTFLIWKLSR